MIDFYLAEKYPIYPKSRFSGKIDFPHSLTIVKKIHELF
jgi:hypothetical protein